MLAARRALAGVACLAIVSGVLLVAGTTTSGASTFSDSGRGGDGTIVIEAKALTSHECDATEWHFVITGIEEGVVDAPASIHVTWQNGDSADVPLLKVTGGVAHYRTTANLDSTVTSATAVISDQWTGQFNLSHGPCGEATTTTTEATTTTTEATTTTTEATTTSSVPATTTSTEPSTTTTAVVDEELPRTGSASLTYTVWGLCLIAAGTMCLAAQVRLATRRRPRWAHRAQRER